MNNYELSKMKRGVIAKAWLAEKFRICKGEGTRNWSVIQQDDILNYNSAVGFVGQFLTDDNNENKMRIQFVEMSIEFLSAHSCNRNGSITGKINTENYFITQSVNISIVKLSEPSYLGYFEIHRSFFIGQDTGFGLKVTVPEKNNEIDISTHKSKFGLDDDAGQIATSNNDSAQNRMKKYGF